eukprot:GHVS01034015.1.p1 GENE.GHVS01034015.1~~GHVS01034015.1.p1  ORF type:complete len:434 (+),score=65.26 GHVS01034015.1:231-1532(+)
MSTPPEQQQPVRVVIRSSLHDSLTAKVFDDLFGSKDWRESKGIRKTKLPTALDFSDTRKYNLVTLVPRAGAEGSGDGGGEEPQLPPIMHPRLLDCLTEINLSNNSLTDDAICSVISDTNGFVNLVNLDLSFNLLKWPIIQILKLKKLNLSNNLIENVISLYFLHSLTYLDLSNNNITQDNITSSPTAVLPTTPAVPPTSTTNAVTTGLNNNTSSRTTTSTTTPCFYDEFQKCVHLQTLLLSHNQLDLFPSQLFYFISCLSTLLALHTLAIHSNPFCSLFPEYGLFAISKLTTLQILDGDSVDVAARKRVSDLDDTMRMQNFDQIVYERLWRASTYQPTFATPKGLFGHISSAEDTAATMSQLLMLLRECLSHPTDVDYIAAQILRHCEAVSSQEVVGGCASTCACTCVHVRPIHAARVDALCNTCSKCRRDID